MTIRVLLFAQLAETIGSREVSLELSEGAKVKDAVAIVMKDYPAVRALDGTLAFAVNERYVDRESPLSENQLLALIPPVSGG